MRSREFTGAMRGAGGVMLALGALLVATRREGRWTEFELLLVTAIPAAVLFTLATVRGRWPAGERAESWRAVLVVTSVLLAPIALFQFLEWVGAGKHHLLLDAAVLVLTALLAAIGARRAQAPYAMFLGGLALLGAWMLVWIKIFPDPSGNTVRWLLLGGGVALLLASALADVSGTAGAGELATAGALGAVAAGILGVIISALGAVFPLEGPSEQAPPLFGGSKPISGAQTTAWDIYLLIAARARVRGPGYVGAFGILLFLVSTLAQLARIESGHAHSHSLLGWPLVLVVLGVAGLAAPLLRRRAA